LSKKNLLPISSATFCTAKHKKYCIGPFRTKGVGMLTTGVVLLHDNARLYKGACAQALLEHFNWELTTLLTALLSLKATATCLPA
jgi:hypothetical protein